MKASTVAAKEFPERFDHGLAQAVGGQRIVADLADHKRGHHAHQHEAAGDPVHQRPRQMVGQDQRQRAGHQRRQPVGIDEERVAGSQFVVRQQFPTIGVNHDVLARREQRDQEHQHDDGLQGLRRVVAPEQADRDQQRQLRHQRPATPAPEERRPEAVHQRGPQEFPGVRQRNQREQADGGEVDTVAAQPRRHQLQQDVQRHP
ncbi:MAG: hypothetical protein PVI46_04960 [Lysobacterales bacterium]|jgi:hypothetical protein